MLSLDAVLVLGLAAVGLVLRLPYLWTIPRFTDETREVLRAIELLNGGLSGADALVNVDAYIGGLYLWLLAGLFWLTGVSALTPRLVMAVAGAVAVGGTYLLARDLGGRLAGLLAAALLATSGGQILSNGHIAWSHCLTPTLTTLATWLLQRAVRLDCRGSWLGSGFTFGLALQTHPATLGAAARRRRLRPLVGPPLARTPWPYLALALFVLAFANVLVFNLMTAGGTLREAATVRDRYDAGIVVNVLIYLGNHLTHGLMLLRYLAGAVDMRGGPAAYLLDPTLWLYGGLSLAGLVYCRPPRRAAAAADDPLLDADHAVLQPAQVRPDLGWTVSDAAAAAGLRRRSALLLAAGLAARRRRAAERWRLGFAVGALLLVLYPLVPLTRYFGQEIAGRPHQQPLLRPWTPSAPCAGPDEAVLLDRDLADIKLEGGGTAFRSLRFLLAGVGIDDRSIDSVSDYAGKMTPGSSALLVTDARGFETLGPELDRLAAAGIKAQRRRHAARPRRLRRLPAGARRQRRRTSRGLDGRRLTCLERVVRARRPRDVRGTGLQRRTTAPNPTGRRPSRSRLPTTQP